MEADCRCENAPPLPVLKSFTLPGVTHLISLLPLLLPPPLPRLPAATGCSGATALEATAPRPGAFAAGQGEREAGNNGLLDAPMQAVFAQTLPPLPAPRPGAVGGGRRVGREPRLQRVCPERGRAGGPLPCWLGSWNRSARRT